MKKILYNCFFVFLVCLISTLSFAEAPKNNKNLIESYVLIEHKFSGVELNPIVDAFLTWSQETKNDIIVNPPTIEQKLYFHKVLLPNIGDEDSLALDNSDPKKAWGNSCSKNFYILRTVSSDPRVMLIDNIKNENNSDRRTGVLAYTFLGCKYKFIVVVADRINDEEMFKVVLMHELGHIWGLPDNEKGQLSIMNGMYPMSTCITKLDIQTLYDIHEKKIPSKLINSGCSNNSK